MEADFREYYGVDLRDLWRPLSGLSVRLVISLLYELPRESRTMRSLIGDAAELDIKEHLLLDVLDLLNITAYWTVAGASAMIDKKSMTKVVQAAPKRILRPGEKPEKPRFASKEEMKQLFPIRG